MNNYLKNINTILKINKNVFGNNNITNIETLYYTLDNYKNKVINIPTIPAHKIIVSKYLYSDGLRDEQIYNSNISKKYYYKYYYYKNKEIINNYLHDIQIIDNTIKYLENEYFDNLSYKEQICFLIKKYQI